MLHNRSAARGSSSSTSAPRRGQRRRPRGHGRQGLRIPKDQYVPLHRRGAEGARGGSPRETVEVTEFVPVAEVDPVYYDKPYYLGPDKGGNKAYWLMNGGSADDRAACALAEVRCHAASSTPRDAARRREGLVMQHGSYTCDESAPSPRSGLDREEGKDAELKLAKMLIEQRAGRKFHPEAYEDEVEADPGTIEAQDRDRRERSRYRRRAWQGRGDRSDEALRRQPGQAGWPPARPARGTARDRKRREARMPRSRASEERRRAKGYAPAPACQS